MAFNPFEPVEDAAPYGLQQAGDQASGTFSPFAPAATDQYGWNDPMAPRKWYTGANMQGTQQGYDTPFYRKWMAQQEQSVKDNTTGNYFDQDKATGIVSYDHVGQRKNAKGENVQYKFGDVYNDGAYQGNIVDSYGESTANMLMSNFMLDADTKQHAMQRGAGDKDKVAAELGGEVTKKRQEFEQNNAALASQRSYENQVAERVSDYQQGPEEAATIAAAAATGAVTWGGIGTIAGSWLGPGALVTGAIGAGLGAVSSGVAAWLNKDEILDQAARASVKTTIAKDQVGSPDGGFFTGLENWSALAQSFSNPLKNILHGSYDRLEGDAGDAESEYYKRDAEGDKERPWWMTAADLGAGVADAAVQFVSPTGRMLYATTMSSVIAGKSGELLATGGQSFDDRTGAFDNIFEDKEGNFSLKSSAAGIADVGIDVVQLGAAHGLARSAGDAAKATKGIFGKEAVETGGVRRWQGGKSYLVNPETDRVIKDSSVRYTSAWLAPSEMIQNVTGHWMARAAVRREAKAGASPRVVEADDVYQAIAKLSNGSRQSTAALVNGFGEGAEEFVQAVAEPVSHESKIDWDMVAEASLQGFAMGAGMSLGAGYRRPTADVQAFGRYVTATQIIGGKTLTEEEHKALKSQWDGFTETEKRAASAIDSRVAQIAFAAGSKLAKSGNITLAGNTPLLETFNNNNQIVKARETGKLNPNVDSTVTLSVTSDAREFNHGAYSSAAHVVKQFTEKVAGLDIILKAAQRNQKVTLRGEVVGYEPVQLPEAEQAARVADLERQLKFANEMLDAARMAERDVRAQLDPKNPNGSKNQAKKILKAHNRKMRANFEGDRPGLTPEERISLMKAASIPLSRSPNDNPGSYQLLMPQMQYKLTEVEGNNGIQISTAINQALGADFDGDQTMSMNLMEWNDQSFRAVRSGQTFIGNVGAQVGQKNADGTPVEISGIEAQIGERQWEEAEIYGIHRAMQQKAGPLKKAATAFIAEIRNGLVARYTNDEGGTLPTLTTQEIDELIRHLVGQIKADNTNARGALISEALFKYPSILVRADAKFTNEWLEMDQIFQGALQEWQTVWATTTSEGPITFATDNVVGEPETNTEVATLRAEVAATPGMTLPLILEGRNPQRQAQKLHYSVWLAQVIKHGNIDQAPTFDEYRQWYAILSEHHVDQAVVEGLASDRVTGRVLDQLWKMSREMNNLSEGKVTRLGTMVQMAMMKVPNYQEVLDDEGNGTGQMVNTGDVALVQVLLRKSIAEERRQFEGVISPEEELQLAKQTGLLKNGRAGEALVEVVANVKLYDLIGVPSDIIGRDLTVRQAVLEYACQNRDARRISRENFHRAPEHNNKSAGNGPYPIVNGRIDVTAYQVLIDAIVDAGNKHISVDDDGVTTGHHGDSGPSSEDSDGIAGVSWTTIMNLYESLDLIQQGMRKFAGYRKMDSLTPANLAVLTQENQAAAMQLFKLIMPHTNNVVMEYRSPSKGAPKELFVAPWVFEMLALPPEEGAMHYLRMGVINAGYLAEYAQIKGEDANAEVTFNKLTSRWSQLIFRLAQNDAVTHKLKMFTRDLAEAKNIFTFMKLVNTVYRGNEAPYSAFSFDVNDFDSNRSTLLPKGGGPASELRAAAAELRSRSQEMLDVLSDAAARDTSNIAVANEMLAAIEAERNGAPASVKLQEFRKTRAFTAALPMLTSPKVMWRALTIVQFGIGRNQHDKGTVAPDVMPNGETTRHEGSPGEGVAEEKWVNKLTAIDTSDLAQNMSAAAQDDYVMMDENGQTVIWKRPSEVEWLTMWRDEPEKRPALQAMYMGSMWEGSESGGLVQQALAPPSLSEFITLKGFLTDMVRGQTQADKAQFVMLVDAMAKEHGLSFGMQVEINDIATAQIGGANHTLTPSELNRKNRKLTDQVADIYRMVGEMERMGVRGWEGGVVGGKRINGLRRAFEIVQNTIVGQAFDRQLKLSDADVASGVTETFLQALIDDDYVRALYLQDQEIAAQKESREVLESTGRAMADHENFKARIEQLRGGNFVKKLELEWTFDRSNELQTELLKRSIIQYVHDHPEMVHGTDWALDALTSMHLQFRNKEWVLEGLQLPDKQWDILARAVIARQIAYQLDPVSHGISLPEYADPTKKELARYNDPTYMYLVDHMLDPSDPRVKAAKKMHRQVEITSVPPTPEALAKKILDTILDMRNYGRYTDDILVASIHGQQRIANSSSTNAAITTSGNLPKRDAAEHNATMGTYAMFADNIEVDKLFTKLVISGDDLSNVEGATVDVTIPIVTTENGQPVYSTRTVKMPTMMLNGRAYRSVTATYRGVPVSVPQMVNPGELVDQTDLLKKVPGFEAGMPFIGNDALLASPYMFSTVNRLKKAVLAAVTTKGEQVEWDDVEFTIEFLHPDSQPFGQEWINSRLFEGTVYEVPGMQHQSLISTNEGAGGVLQRSNNAAISAPKTGELAQHTNKPPSAKEIERLDKGSLVNLSATIAAKALIMVTRDTGKGVSPTHMYNKHLKRFKMRHWLRGFDPETGEPVLWGAEQVIDAQLHGKRLPDNAEIIRVSPKVLRTMLGEVGEHGIINSDWNWSTNDITSVQPWNGDTTAIALRVPGLLAVKTNKDGSKGFADGDLFQSHAIQSRILTMYQGVRNVPKRVLTEYERGLETNNAKASRVTSLRRNLVDGEKKVSEQNRKGAEYLETAVDQTTVAAVFADMNLPMGSWRASSDAVVQSVASNLLSNTHFMNPWNVIWVFDPTNSAGTANGEFSVADLEDDVNGRETPESRVKGDTVVIRLEGYERLGEDLTVDDMYDEAIKHIRRMAGTQVNIMIPEATGKPGLAARLSATLRDEMQYDPYLGARGVFRPREYKNELSQNERGRLTSSREVREISGHNTVVSVVAYNPVGLGDGAAYLMDQEGFNQQAVKADLLMTNWLGLYNVPTTEESIRRAQTLIRELWEHPTGPAHLVKLAGAEPGSAEANLITREMKRLIEWWDAHPKSGSILPTDGKYRIGAIMPMIGPNDAIVLARNGYKAPGGPGMDVREEVNKQLADTGGDADGKPRNFAIFGTERASDWTTHEGDILGYEPSGPTGLRIKLLISLQAYFAKLQHEGLGLKNLLTTVPDDVYLPVHNIFKGIKVALIHAWADIRDKEAGAGMVKNFQKAWGNIGYDHMPYLVKFFTGSDEVNDDTKSTVYAVMEEIRQLSIANPLTEKQVAQYFLQANPDRVLAELASDFPPGFLTKIGLSQDKQAQLSNPANRSYSDHVAFAAIMYMRLPNANLNHILKASGIINGAKMNSDSRSHFPPSIYTTYFDKLPRGSAARTQAFQDLNDRFNKVGMVKGESYSFSEDFMLHIRTKGKKRNRLSVGWLMFSQPFSSGDDVILNAQADERRTSQGDSYHTGTISPEAVGARMATAKDLNKTRAFVTSSNIVRGLDGGALWRMYNDVAKAPLPAHIVAPNFAQRKYLRRAWKEIGLYAHQISTKGWNELDEPGAEGSEALWLVEREKVAIKFGLLPEQAYVIDHWVRQFLGSPYGTEGDVSREMAFLTLDQLSENADGGYLPTFGAEVPLLNLSDLSMLFRANRDSSTEFKLRDKFDGRLEKTSWEDWVNTSLGVYRVNKEFDQMYLLAVDGMFHTYRQAGTAFGSLGISVNQQRELDLLDPAFSEMLISLDPDRIIELGETPLFEGRDMTLDDFDVVVPGARVTRGRFAPKAVQSRKFRFKMAWRKRTGSPHPVSKNFRDFTSEGGDLVHESTSTNALLQTLIELRFMNATLNPALYPSALLETITRGALEDLTGILMGNSTTLPGMAHAWLAAKTPKQLREFAEKFGFMPSININEIHSVRRAATAAATFPQFKAMIKAETDYELEPAKGGKILGVLHKGAKLGQKLQDPTLGMRQDTLARRYADAAATWILNNRTDNTASIEYVMSKFAKNPYYIRDEMPEAHNAGIAVIANIRMLKPQVPSLAISGFIEPLTKHPNTAVAGFSTLAFKLPLMFHNFAINVGTNMLGLQGPMAMWAMHLDGKRNPTSQFWHRLTGREYDPEKHGYYDMSSIIETQDLSKAFIQSGVSLTSLFAAGMMAGGLGLSGEDEEDKRRRRAIQLHGGAYLYDPRKVENDFRNADAIFLDNLPFGTGMMIAALCGDVNQGRPMIQPYWTVKQFISPMMGMERFFETGDFRQVVWGFKDALGAFPLINSASWHESLRVYNDLTAEAADQESLGTVEGLSNAFRLRNTVIMTFERMLMENSFVNTIYTGMDDYDRDPFIIPERTGEGEIWRDREGTPRPTKMLEDYVDDAGNVKSRYVKAEAGEASEKAYSENRLGYAVFKFLSSGLRDDSYFRQNMVVKTRSIQKPEMTEDYAQALVMSIIDPKDGSERLTTAGAKAIFHGLSKQALTLESPALQGVYMPMPMRKQIQADWLNDMTQELIDKGYTESKAKYEANIRWKGDYRDPSKPGYASILFSDKIPYNKDIRYKQLNTTYVIGPDGLPWATGIKRATWQAALGLQPGLSYLDGGQGSNLPVDSVLNSVDDVLNINTGLRALRRTDDSWIVPTPEEIGKSIEDAIKENAGKAYTPSNWKDFGNGYGYRRGRGYGGGGGGGGGYPARMQAPPRNITPYGHDLQDIRPASTFIRRADIHRERFDSDRGRLNQWQ